MPKTYERISYVSTSSGATDIDFTNISSIWTDLVVVCSVQNASAASNLLVRFNGDTGTNYSYTSISGNGSSASSFRSGNQTSIQPGVAGTSPSTSILHILSATNTNIFKTAISADEYPGIALYRRIHLWRSTSPITSIKIFVASGTFTAGSTAALYGIRAA